jgi:hypothetical protein
MNTARMVGEAIFGLMFIPWVFGEAIRLTMPRYHARMLKVAKEGRWTK